MRFRGEVVSADVGCEPEHSPDFIIVDTDEFKERSKVKAAPEQHIPAQDGRRILDMFRPDVERAHFETEEEEIDPFTQTVSGDNFQLVQQPQVHDRWKSFSR